jgi:hypothetical protein
MVTSNFGVFGSSPMLSQFRFQVAWATNDYNQVGLWSTIQDQTANRATGALGTPVSYRAIDQLNLFWDHQFGASGAVSRLYIGTPLGNRLAQTPNGFPVGGTGGTLGALILGSNWTVPINDRVSLYANGMYMAPSARPGISGSGAAASAQEFWDVSFGVSFSPRGNARSRNIAGRTWLPYLPVANNSSFLVDSSKTE